MTIIKKLKLKAYIRLCIAAAILAGLTFGAFVGFPTSTNHETVLDSTVK